MSRPVTPVFPRRQTGSWGLRVHSGTDPSLCRPGSTDYTPGGTQVSMSRLRVRYVVVTWTTVLSAQVLLCHGNVTGLPSR